MNNVQETKVNEEVTVLTDELGLQREYREVKREANVGERIKIVNPFYINTSAYKSRDIHTVRISNPETEEQYAHVYAYGIDICILTSEYVVLEPTDIIRYNNERYRLESRKAEVGEKVVVVDAQCNVTYKNGDIRTVLRRWNNNLGFRSEEHGSNICDDEYRVLVPAKSAASALTANVNVKLCEDTTKIIDMLTSLSTKVTELEREVQTLKDANIPESTAKSIIDAVAKAPKQLTRADVVAKAQADIDALKSDMTNVSNPHLRDRNDVYLVGLVGYCAKFIVNREKRTIVCLLRYAAFPDGDVRLRGIAKCAPEDVFNVDIGKAIALRRALGLKVPSEYTDAPKPEGVAVGDVVETFLENGTPHRTFKVAKIGYDNRYTKLHEDETTRMFSPFEPELGDRVINDSDREEYRKGARC
ncbi:hypothetical protein [Aneurinibacillus migulanus]|uniref:hypothetical protein n=1 Tax=Aneurinibacillus migulanus TaxID=47500 RepID=UPI0020A1127B|nr:hypothetical protein [Aneurinibacillus migulanus]MCP1354641.1 hypothetical protein [Aneurinibacillus migulanus]